MARYSLVKSTAAHAEELAANMREEDAAECWAVANLSPLQSLLPALMVSRDAWTGLADGKVLAMFGVAVGTALSESGCPWLLGSRDVPNHGRAFLRVSREYIRDISPRYAILVNYVDARYTTAIRWIAWLGFTVADAEPFGPDGFPFRRFYMVR